MALRTVRQHPDEILKKISRKVEKIDARLLGVLDDMLDTMRDIPGYGIAGVQVGVLRRVVVIDVGEGPLFLINPEITSSEGEETGIEGCLSVPGFQGRVVRPVKVSVSYLDRDGVSREIQAEGLLKKALCHEIDHLDGILYIDRAESVYEIPAAGEDDGQDDDDEDFDGDVPQGDEGGGGEAASREL